MALRPNFVEAKSFSKAFHSPNVPAVTQCDLLIGKLADRTLSPTERGYIALWVAGLRDTMCGDKRTLTLEYDRNLTTRDLVDCDIVSFCAADTCIEAVLDGVKLTSEGDEGGETAPDKYVSGAAIVDGPGGSKRLRLIYSDDSEPILVTLPSEVTGSPSPYPVSFRIDEVEGGNELVLVLSDEEEVEILLPAAVVEGAYVSSVELIEGVLTFSVEGGDDIEIELPSGEAGSSGVLSSNNATESAIEAEFTEGVAGGVIVRWTDANGIKRISFGNSGGWVHAFGNPPISGVARPFAPIAKQSLTTTYADIAGSSEPYTPLSEANGSIVVYEYSFQLASDDVAEEALAHVRLVVGGSVASGSMKNFRSTSSTGYRGDLFVTYRHAVPSWGKTERTMKLQGREYSSTGDTKVHEAVHVDGVATNGLVNAVLKIQEFLP